MLLIQEGFIICNFHSLPHDLSSMFFWFIFLDKNCVWGETNTKENDVVQERREKKP